MFGNYIRIRNVSFFIDGQNIEIVKEFKYLGALFTKIGRFVQHVKHLSNVACKQCIC